MSAIDRLLSDEFADALFPVSTVEAVHEILKTRPEVLRVRDEIDDWVITPSQIHEFAASLIRNFRRGQRLPGDMALAGLAVALTSVKADYAESFLRDLAAVGATELPVSRRVAQRALVERATLVTPLTTRSASLPVPDTVQPYLEILVPISSGTTARAA